MLGINKEISNFYSWVNYCKGENINIGPINETLITLYEDVIKVKLSEKNKSEILKKN